MTMPYYPSALEPQTEPPKRSRSMLFKAGLVGVGLAAGALGATAIGASAASGNSTAPSASSTSTAGSTTDTGDTGGDHAGGGGHAGEKAPSAAITATLRTAALKAVPGGTIDRVESDSGDATYEAHMTKSDGTKVTVKFDKNLKVTGVEAGMGK